MGTLEIIADARRRYTETVKPRIADRNYIGAYVEMDKIVSTLKENQDDIIADVHFGLALISAAETLYRELVNGKPGSKTIEDFEAFSAQTKLPKRKAGISDSEK